MRRVCRIVENFGEAWRDRAEGPSALRSIAIGPAQDVGDCLLGARRVVFREPRLVAFEQPLQDSGITLTYGYDSAGNVTSIVDSQGGAVTSTYNNDGSLASTSQSGAGITPMSAQYSYDDESNLSEVCRTEL